MTNNELCLELVAELTKKNIQSKKVQQLCQRLKIPYNGDVVELMTFMLGSGMISKNLKEQTTTKKTNHDINL
ncbi:MAG: hypothetical protein V4654_07510 [Bdellovibrionota bacterium]